MKRIKKLSFLFLTLCAAMSMLTFVAAASKNELTVNPDLILNPQTTLTVFIDGAANDALSGNYPYGESVTISAPAVAKKDFQYWTSNTGAVISYNANLTLTMYANTTVNAVYGTSNATAQTTAAFLNVTRTDGEIIFNTIASAKGDISEAGIRYSTTKSTLDDLKGSADVTVEKAGNTSANWAFIVTPADENATYYAIAYATVNGQTTYSAVKTVQFSELQNGVSMLPNLDKIDLSKMSADFATVTFVSNGGEGVMEPQGVVKNTKTALTANTLTREGYTFNGWSTTANGSVTYSDGQTVTLSSDTTLYAQWKSVADPVHTHSWGEWKVTKPATCVAKGERKRICSECKQEETREIAIDPKNHTGKSEIRGAKKATESAEGYTGDTYCKDCGVKLKSGKSIPKLEQKPFTNFRTLRLVAKRDTNSITLRWRKYGAASGYLIYGSKCGDGSKMKLLKTIKGNKTVQWTQKKLKKGTYYKYKVVAYKNVKGKKKALVNSVVAHTVTHDGKTTAVKAVKVNKTSVSLKKGKTFQIKASEVKENKKKKIDHHREIRYESSNKKIATVAKNGKVKGVKKGTAAIFVYSENGFYKTVKVTVK